MFILTKAYDSLVAEHPAASMQARFRRLMSSAGTSVVVTLLASAVAFALGAINELPSVRWFSVYATMGVVSILVATVRAGLGCGRRGVTGRVWRQRLRRERRLGGTGFVRTTFSKRFRRAPNCIVLDTAGRSKPFHPLHARAPSRS